MATSFEELWAAVKAAPTDKAAHDRFINFAVASNRYLDAIESYKKLAESGGELAGIAEERKRSIAMRVAAQTLLATPVQAIDRPRIRKGAVMVGFGAVTLIIGGTLTKFAVLVGLALIGLGVFEIRAARKS